MRKLLTVARCISAYPLVLIEIMPKGSHKPPAGLEAAAVAHVRGIIHARPRGVQTEVARVTGVSPSQLSEILSGKKPVTVAQLAAICDALDLDLVDVIRAAEAER